MGVSGQQQWSLRSCRQRYTTWADVLFIQHETPMAQRNYTSGRPRVGYLWQRARIRGFYCGGGHKASGSGKAAKNKKGVVQRDNVTCHAPNDVEVGDDVSPIVPHESRPRTSGDLQHVHAKGVPLVDERVDVHYARS